VISYHLTDFYIFFSTTRPSRFASHSSIEKYPFVKPDPNPAAIKQCDTVERTKFDSRFFLLIFQITLQISVIIFMRPDHYKLQTFFFDETIRKKIHLVL